MDSESRDYRAIFGPYTDAVMVFGKGTITADFGMIEGKAGNKTAQRLTLVVPDSVTGFEFNASDGYSDTEKELDTHIDTIYFYGETPPEDNSGKGAFFRNVKTIYVPKTGVDVYKKEYAGITSAEFKALPEAYRDFEVWTRPAPADKRAVQAAYRSVAAEGRQLAMEEDRQLRETYRYLLMDEEEKGEYINDKILRSISQ